MGNCCSNRGFDEQHQRELIEPEPEPVRQEEFKFKGYWWYYDRRSDPFAIGVHDWAMY